MVSTESGNDRFSSGHFFQYNTKGALSGDAVMKLARNPNSKVILVGTFLDKLCGTNKANEVSRIKKEVLDRYGTASETYGGLCSILDPENIIFVSCINNKEGQYTVR